MRTQMRLWMTVAISWIAVSAFAQNNRSFVATFGNDANDCTANHECRSFTRALSVTNAGGEVVAINSGGFGPFIANKAITVAAAAGVRASITTSSSDGISVLAGASDRVVLSGLTIFVDPTHYGIGVGTFDTLTVKDCSITGGLFGMQVSGPSGSFLTIMDTVIRDSAVYGAVLSSHAALIRCRIEGSGNAGLYINEGFATDGVVTAVDLVSVKNIYGVYATCGTAGHNVAFDLDRGLISSNVDNGVYSNASAGTAVVRVSNSTVTENGFYGFDQSGVSTFYSRGNNMVSGNGFSDTVGTISPLPAQ